MEEIVGMEFLLVSSAGLKGVQDFLSWNNERVNGNSCCDSCMLWTLEFSHGMYFLVKGLVLKDFTQRWLIPLNCTRVP